MKRRNREFKALARQALQGHFSLYAGAVILLFAFSTLLSNISALFVSSDLNMSDFFTELLVNFIVAVLTYLFEIGLYAMLLHMIRGEDFGMGDLFYAFKHGPDRFIIVSGIQLLITLLLEAPALFYTYMSKLSSVSDFAVYGILLLAGSLLSVILLLGFMPAVYLLIDDEDLDAMEAIHESFSMMRGQKVRYLLLRLSFIGMLCLAVLSLGIALIWLTPYMEATSIFFYLELNGEPDAPGRMEA